MCIDHWGSCLKPDAAIRGPGRAKIASMTGSLGTSILPPSSKALEDRSPAFAADEMKQRSHMSELYVPLHLLSLGLGNIEGQRQMEVLRRGGLGQGGGGRGYIRLPEVHARLIVPFHLFSWE